LSKVVYFLKMSFLPADRETGRGREEASEEPSEMDIPLPSQQFRHRSWREFQRALDPLAPPKPLPMRGRRPH